jgi:hypothetical protein
MTSINRNFLISIVLVNILFSCLVASIALGNHGISLTLEARRSPTCRNTNHTYTTSTSHVPTTTTDEILQQGWTSGPDGRGTLDILWSCLITISLYSWTVLCLNVPPPYWGQWRLLRQKLLMAGLGGIGPEFIFQLALAQWTSACRSVESFHDLGHSKWSMTHAFFADMGGFVLHAEDHIPFPLDGEQVLYLVKEGYVAVPTVVVDKMEIQDKNKGDGMARFLTVCQIIWFSVNSISRIIQHLAITTLELTTLGFILCTLGTYFFWAHKPMDVGTSITLVPKTSLAQILRNARQPTPPVYQRTPLDFVDRKQWTSWMLPWTYWLNILRKLGIVFHPIKRPIDKIADDYTPDLSPWTQFILFILYISYAAVHVAGWNFHFPSQIEVTAWHIATLTIMVAICIDWVTIMLIWQVLPAAKKYFAAKRQEHKGAIVPLSGNKELKVSMACIQSSPLPAPGKTPVAQTTLPSLASLCLSYPRTILRNVAQSFRNNSPDRDPALDVPLKAIIPITLFAACYIVARAYILIEDLVNLRAQPASAFETVQWANFLPHI